MPKEPSQPTQQFLAIDKIHDDVVILKGGGLRTVLMASSINFALKSENEQNAIIYQFQNFLNSLDYSIQIVIQSRKLRITDYLNEIKKFENQQTNELLRVQTAEYGDFISSFVESSNIMSKSFYIVVPYTPPIISAKKTGAVGKLFGKKTTEKKIEIEEKEKQFLKDKAQLWQRLENIRLGIKAFGIRSQPLTTAELIELFYTMYNPLEAERGVVFRSGQI